MLNFEIDSFNFVTFLFFRKKFLPCALPWRPWACGCCLNFGGSAACSLMRYPSTPRPFTRPSLPSTRPSKKIRRVRLTLFTYFRKIKHVQDLLNLVFCSKQSYKITICALIKIPANYIFI